MIQEIIQANHFTLLRQREIAEMQGTLWEMTHEQSGAKLCWLQRADENMTFAIAAFPAIAAAKPPRGRLLVDPY